MVKNLEQNDCYLKKKIALLFPCPVGSHCFSLTGCPIPLSLSLPSQTAPLYNTNIACPVSIADGFRKLKKVVFYVKDKFLYTETIKLYCVVVL